MWDKNNKLTPDLEFIYTLIQVEINWLILANL